MIHLDPRWLIELVRRVVDPNLVDKTAESQRKIWDELGSYSDERGHYTPDGYSNLHKAHT